MTPPVFVSFGDEKSPKSDHKFCVFFSDGMGLQIDSNFPGMQQALNNAVQEGVKSRFMEEGRKKMEAEKQKLQQQQQSKQSQQPQQQPQQQQ